jgi:predicted aminopeptidase
VKRLRTALLVAGTLLLGACDSVGYYSQAISGQLQILVQRRAIPSLLDESSTPETLRQQLQQVQALREFADAQLQLPVGRQFSSYVDVEAPYVVWNVFAAPEFSLEPLTWCFPVAGCVSYRGYFSEQAARKFAQELQAQGHDVYVGGVTAYSTLGWFADPVLNTVIGREPWQLASLIFHELAHQVVYVQGDTTFNESFATTVEQLGLQRWLQQTEGEGAAQALLAQTERAQQQREQFVALVQTAVADLRRIYAGSAPATNQMATAAPSANLGADASAANQHADILRVAKQARLAQLREQYEQLKQQWGGDSSYDLWFAQDLNNAQLLTVATYNSQVPVFRRLLRDCNQDLPCFYAEAQRLAALDAPARQAALAVP